MLLNKILLLCILLASVCPSVVNASYVWNNDKYDQLYEAIMPIKLYKFGEFPRTIQWEVRMRINDAFADPWSIVLSKSYSGKVEVDLIRIDGDSLFDQVDRITAVNPDASISDIANKIKLTHTMFDNNKCSNLSNLANDFEHIYSNILLPGDIMNDATKYYIIIQNRVNYLQLSYSGAGPKASTQDIPVIDWAERLRRLIIQECK